MKLADYWLAEFLEKYVPESGYLPKARIGLD
jgi:hypothetical protein